MSVDFDSTVSLLPVVPETLREAARARAAEISSSYAVRLESRILADARILDGSLHPSQWNDPLVAATVQGLDMLACSLRLHESELAALARKVAWEFGMDCPDMSGTFKGPTHIA